MAGENEGQLALEALADCEEILTEAITPGILRGDMVFVAQAKARRVLARPKRNCDVGTPAEQSVRYEKFCFEHRTMERCCEDCPLKSEPCCELAWAQLPYEEAANADADADA